MKLELINYLKKLPKNKPVYYFPNPGNGGDSLIACATFQAFKEAGIKYRVVRNENFDSNGKILICPGGGNFTNYYPNTRNFLRKYHASAERVIILPHTISGNEELINQLGQNVDIITREKVSYDYVGKTVSRANVYLADDVAFSLDVGKVLKYPSIFLAPLMSATIPSRRIQKGNSFEIQYLLSKLKGKNRNKILSAFRTDKERTKMPIPEGNIDIAEIFSYGTTERRALYATHRILNFLSQFDEIRTSRLHTCVAGALLGKKVKFYPNNYYKCEAVYQFSIRDRFPNVIWLG
jgi:exopolysaccharide biosynthesis predicted pyruvyltransferase EpsI